MHVHRLLRLATALLLLGVLSRTWAQSNDTVSVTAAYGLQTDSNLFRLPSSAQAQNGRDESIRVSTLGLHIDKPYSLQRVQLNVNLVDSQYQNFSYLSYVAHNADAAWRWSATPQVHGSLTSSYKQSLNSFADNPTLNVRNQRTDTNTRMDATYELGAAWLAVGGITLSKQTNVQALVAEGDTSTTVGDAGLHHVWPSGSTLSYTVRDTRGRYINRAISSANLLDNGFRQMDNELRLFWIVSGKSSIDLASAYIHRSHNHFAQRDYSGLTASATLNWAITGKSALNARWARELSSYQTSNINLTQTDRLSLSPVWSIGPKTTLRLRFEIALRNYLDSPGILPASQRRDTIRDASISLDWQPYQHLSLSAGLQKSQRSSNQLGLDFDSNMASFSAQYSY